MLSCLLNSDCTISVNIQIIRLFSRMRQMFKSQKELLKNLENHQMKDLEQDEKISIIFEYLRQLDQARDDEAQFKARKRIGFRRYT